MLTINKLILTNDSLACFSQIKFNLNRVDYSMMLFSVSSLKNTFFNMVAFGHGEALAHHNLVNQWFFDEKQIKMCYTF